MTSTIAFIGKSGSGKTTLAQAFYNLIRNKFKNASILIVDNDLSFELSQNLGIKTKNTIYGIKSGKHEYKTGIPEGMSKQEFIEWALEDTIVAYDENTDVVVSWFVTPKDCKCPSTKLMRDGFLKLIERYDFVIFDCEYDLKYLNLLVDYPIDEAIIVSKSSKKDIMLAYQIALSSKKYAPDGQLGVILNKIKKDDLSSSQEFLKDYELDLIGAIEYLQDIEYDIISQKLESLYQRMNLPQIDGFEG